MDTAPNNFEQADAGRSSPRDIDTGGPEGEQGQAGEVSMSRIIDGCATAHDWDAMVVAATAQPSLWRELALSQRDAAVISRVVKAEAQKAEGVTIAEVMEGARESIERGLSFERAARDGSGDPHLSPERLKMAQRTRHVATWAGWGVAAMLTVAMVNNGLLGTRAGGGEARDGRGTGALEGGMGGSQAAVPFGTAAQALEAYLDKGQKAGVVMNAEPKLKVLGYSPAPDGKGYDVWYERSILERARVENMYRVMSDELGAPAAVPVEPMQMEPAKPARRAPAL